GADFRHRPEGAIHDLFLRWGTPSNSTTPDAARLNAALVMRTWGLTTTTSLGRALVDRRGTILPAPAWNGSASSLPPLPAVPRPEHIYDMVDRAIDEAVRGRWSMLASMGA
ncbi:MAG: hypothetical protein M3Z03_03705, partial [Actinomycetota bacterium]|nr:hypothetical protein [Actinomycetota bacterium]